MVQNSRKTPGAGSIRSVNLQPVNLRPLNLPVPVTVQEDACQRPIAVSKSLPARSRKPRPAPYQGGAKPPGLKVVSIDNTWKIDEEWWREKPIVRMYYQVTTEDGRRITLFRDLTTGDWYQQRG